MTLTGANADYRIQIKPSEEGAVAVQLYNLIAAKQAHLRSMVERISPTCSRLPMSCGQTGVSRLW